jgi:cell shape-determining protein MreC
MTFIELKEEISRLKAELALRADYAQMARDLLIENNRLNNELQSIKTATSR